MEASGGGVATAGSEGLLGGSTRGGRVAVSVVVVVWTSWVDLSAAQLVQFT
jgi:hypothetical protein